MNFKQKLLSCSSSFLLGGIFLPITVSAQGVTSDGTLSTKVTSPDNRNFTITNGNQPNNGANLFHSFSNFSLPTGGSATFDLVNTPNISTIFSRVTGGNVSNIDGLIQTTNNSNPVSLFLLNPSGIIFGPNARLNIGGSFIGTTASRIEFVNGTEFSAVDPSSGAPLLRVSAPIGLIFGQPPAAIAVRGAGHRITSGSLGQADRSNNPIGLQVAAGNTLALIGGAVNFDGGIAELNGGGHLEVGSVGDGQVKLNPTGQGWVGDYTAVRQFSDIHLALQSLLDASGTSSSLQLQGRNIGLTDGSVLLLQNLGAQPSRGITIGASESLSLTGITSDTKIPSFIQIDNLGIAPTGDISISARQLSIHDGANIFNSTFTPITGGNVTLKIADTIDLEGFAPTIPSISSQITTSTSSSGMAGDIRIATSNLRILNGGSILSFSVSSGQAGLVQIEAKDLIEIASNNPFTALPSSITSTAINTGDAGSTVINTARLTIRDSGALGSSTVAKGAAGSVTVNASESVEISGRSANSILPARIVSTAEILDAATQATFNLPAIPTGDAGSLIVNTPSLRITDGAFVTVKNDGPGTAGDVQINANSIFLDRQGSITASTASGNGGDIKINMQQLLLMRHTSLISATAEGIGNGGNLLIQAPIIVGLENSDIIANAVQGAGGNIAIATQGLFGFKSRPQLTLESDITASSQFGLSGSVNISNLAFTPTTGLIQLPSSIDDPSQKIAQGCRTYDNSRFVATGRGGLPDDPSDRRSSNQPWTDLRDPSTFRKIPNSTAVSQAKSNTPPIVEAIGWRINAKGTVDIYAANNAEIERSVTNCAGLSTISTKFSKGGNIQ
jgi:filamentous hemagglutinin family protein